MNSESSIHFPTEYTEYYQYHCLHAYDYSTDALYHLGLRLLFNLSKPIIMLPKMLHAEEIYGGYSAARCGFGIANKHQSR